MDDSTLVKLCRIIGFGLAVDFISWFGAVLEWLWVPSVWIHLDPRVCCFLKDLLVWWLQQAPRFWYCSCVFNATWWHHLLLVLSPVESVFIKLVLESRWRVMNASSDWRSALISILWAWHHHWRPFNGFTVLLCRVLLVSAILVVELARVIRSVVIAQVTIWVKTTPIGWVPHQPHLSVPFKITLSWFAEILPVSLIRILVWIHFVCILYFLIIINCILLI